MAKNYNNTEKARIGKKEQDLLSEIKENFKVASETYSKQREEAREDFKFRSGDQWDDRIREQRNRDARPALTVNKLGQFIRQVVNNQKINRPSINVNPGDSQAKIEVARVLQAIIKNIESQSMAENAYDTAFDNACTGGEGYFRIITDYADPMSFDQEIYIKAIDNPFSVYIDPNFKSDFSDINWAFIFDDISRDEFERLYPNSPLCTGEMFINSGDTWITENNVRIAEYFFIDYEEVEIVQLKNGEILLKKDYDKLPQDAQALTEIVKTRKTYLKKVKWVKTNGHEILEDTVFPGTHIPVIPVFADTYLVDGQRVFEGVVRQAKDPQRAFNYWTSAEAEMIALAPKAPFIGAEGQFEGHESEWQAANSSNVPYLEYKPVSSGGKDVPPPQRSQFDPQIGTIIQAKTSSNEDLKATTGIYDPSLGTDKKEASGIALLTKQRQAEVTNFMYLDNLSKSLKYTGKILLEIIPLVYDTRRVVRIIGGVNQEDELVVVNSFEEKDSIFLELGKYDCDISIGPYGENQRQEAIESMLSLMQINPQISALIGDIFVGKQDWDGAKEISERLKIMLPPALQGQEELPPEIQAQLAQAQAQYEQTIAQQNAQLQQMQQLIANLTAEANDAKAQANNKQAELESKERIAALNARVELIKAGLKEDAADSRLAFQQELSFAQARQQGAPVVPMQGDEYVLSGVNDPITEAQAEANDELTPEEQAQLLSKLDNFTPQTTQM